MRLTYLVNQRMPTDKAYGIQIVKMCEALSIQGVDVELVIPSRRNPIKKDLFAYYGVKRNFSVVRLFSFDFYLPGRLDKITFIIKNFLSAARLFFYALRHLPAGESRVIFSRDELPLYFLSFFRKNLTFEAHKFSKKRSIFYNRFKKAGLNVVVISGGLKDEFLKFGFQLQKILVAPDGVDLNQFNIIDSKEACRKRLNLPMDKKIVGYVGQLKTMGMEKGIRELILAISSLRSDQPDLLLMIVGGNSQDQQEYKIFAEAAGIKDRVLFLGRKEYKDIPFYLNACDVLAMPFPNIEHYASFMSPLKLFEYMASGRPIISTDLPVIREILNDNNSVLIDLVNKNALADGIKRILDDTNFSEKISRNSLRDVANFSWSKRVASILQFISTS